MCVSGYISEKIRVGKSLLNFFSLKFYLSFSLISTRNTQQMRCLPQVYNEKGSVWASYLSTDEKYDSESGKTNNKWPQVA